MIRAADTKTQARRDVEQPAHVLLVSVPPPRIVGENLSLRSTTTADEAAAEMRMRRFDLLVVSTNVPDLPVWSLVRRVRMARPSQKWALAAGVIEDLEEIEARSLGVLAILPARPTAAQIAALAAPLRRVCIPNVCPRDGPAGEPQRKAMSG